MIQVSLRGLRSWSLGWSVAVWISGPATFFTLWSKVLILMCGVWCLKSTSMKRKLTRLRCCTSREFKASLHSVSYFQFVYKMQFGLSFYSSGWYDPGHSLLFWCWSHLKFLLIGFFFPKVILQVGMQHFSFFNSVFFVKFY